MAVSPAVVRGIGHCNLLQERHRRRGAINRRGMGNEAAVFDFQRVTARLGEGIGHLHHSTVLRPTSVGLSRPATGEGRAAGAIPDTARCSVPGWRGQGRAGPHRGGHGVFPATAGVAGARRRRLLPAPHRHSGWHRCCGA
ncbi:hypothetical protein G6F31_019459 [Rhizopus arrhizus]|nr:hypothetical protein G6F31_019459 [Rhizopus arrhizus]